MRTRQVGIFCINHVEPHLKALPSINIVHWQDSLSQSISLNSASKLYALQESHQSKKHLGHININPGRGSMGRGHAGSEQRPQTFRGQYVSEKKY